MLNLPQLKEINKTMKIRTAINVLMIPPARSKMEIFNINPPGGSRMISAMSAFYVRATSTSLGDDIIVVTVEGKSTFLFSLILCYFPIIMISLTIFIV